MMRVIDRRAEDTQFAPERAVGSFTKAAVGSTCMLSHIRDFAPFPELGERLTHRQCDQALRPSRRALQHSRRVHLLRILQLDHAARIDAAFRAGTARGRFQLGRDLLSPCCAPPAATAVCPDNVVDPALLEEAEAGTGVSSWHARTVFSKEKRCHAPGGMRLRQPTRTTSSRPSLTKASIRPRG